MGTDLRGGDGVLNRSAQFVSNENDDWEYIDVRSHCSIYSETFEFWH